MPLNHPETIPLSLVPGKIVFQGTSLYVKCQKIWGWLPYKMGFGNSSNQRSKKSSTLNCGSSKLARKGLYQSLSLQKDLAFSRNKRESKMIMIRV